MKTRTAKKQQTPQPEQKPAAPELKVVRPEPADEPTSGSKLTGRRGGAREGAGRPAYLKDGFQKEKSAYVSMTDREKEKFKRLAAKDGLTLSFYLRKRLGLPIE
jgi:hypothetical protein